MSYYLSDIRTASNENAHRRKFSSSSLFSERIFLFFPVIFDIDQINRDRPHCLSDFLLFSLRFIRQHVSIDRHHANEITTVFQIIDSFRYFFCANELSLDRTSLLEFFSILLDTISRRNKSQMSRSTRYFVEETDPSDSSR